MPSRFDGAGTLREGYGEEIGQERTERISWRARLLTTMVTLYVVAARVG